jgi:hypothetical protein
MLAKSFLWAWLAVSGTANVPASQPLTAVASPALTEEQLASELVARLVKVCESNPEVERAFVLVRRGPDGSPMYTFVPIFDRKVSDKAIAEADAAYKELFPNRGYLQLTLLARNTWKKSLGGVPPVYVRPGK